MLPPQSYIPVYKHKTTSSIDFVSHLQNGQMGVKNGQMGKYLKGENGENGRNG